MPQVRKRVLGGRSRLCLHPQPSEEPGVRSRAPPTNGRNARPPADRTAAGLRQGRTELPAAAQPQGTGTRRQGGRNGTAEEQERSRNDTHPKREGSRNSTAEKPAAEHSRAEGQRTHPRTRRQGAGHRLAESHHRAARGQPADSPAQETERGPGNAPTQGPADTAAAGRCRAGKEPGTDTRERTHEAPPARAADEAGTGGILQGPEDTHEHQDGGRDTGNTLLHPVQPTAPPRDALRLLREGQRRHRRHQGRLHLPRLGGRHGVRLHHVRDEERNGHHRHPTQERGLPQEAGRRPPQEELRVCRPRHAPRTRQRTVQRRHRRCVAPLPQDVRHPPPVLHPPHHPARADLEEEPRLQAPAPPGTEQGGGRDQLREQAHGLQDPVRTPLRAGLAQVRRRHQADRRHHRQAAQGEGKPARLGKQPPTGQSGHRRTHHPQAHLPQPHHEGEVRRGAETHRRVMVKSTPPCEGS